MITPDLELAPPPYNGQSGYAPPMPRPTITCAACERLYVLPPAFTMNTIDPPWRCRACVLAVVMPMMMPTNPELLGAARLDGKQEPKP